MSTIIELRLRKRVKSNKRGREESEKCTDQKEVRRAVKQFLNAGKLMFGVGNVLKQCQLIVIFLMVIYR
jgi:hypothetical protein